MSIERVVGRLSVLFAIAIVVALVATSGSASAQTCPLACGGRAGQQAKYQAGYLAGQQKADAFFASSEIAKNPKKVQTKVGRVLEKLHLHIRDTMNGEKGIGRRCRVQGVADGFLGRLAQLVGQCIVDGGTWGAFTSELYCELSMELGGLAQSETFVRVPAGLCGTLFQQVCDNVYGYVATEGGESLSPTVTNFLAARNVLVEKYPGCREWTEGLYEDVFEGARTVDCAYGAK